MQIGQAVSADFYFCDYDMENNEQVIQDCLEALRYSGMTVFETVKHEFDPHGLTFIAVLAESHFAVHTYPEHRYMAVDIFTCGSGNPISTIEELRRRFRPLEHEVNSITRGVKVFG